MLLPHGAATWRELLPGAIGAGFLWELAKKAFLFFVATYLSLSNLVYGSVAAIFAFLTWAYLSSLIFLFGAYLSVSYYQLKKQRREAAGLDKGATPVKRVADRPMSNLELPDESGTLVSGVR